MTLPPPWFIHPQLTAQILQKVADWLLEEYYSTLDDLSRDTDSGYGRGCTAFDRQKNRILKEWGSGKWAWLSVSNPNNDMVFSISGIPCRFSNDDPMNPKKRAVTECNEYQSAFQEFSAPSDASRFCFVIDRGLSGAEDPHVEFLGFDKFGAVACRWVSDTARALYLESEQEAPVEQVRKPTVAPRKPDLGRTAASVSKHSDLEP